MPGGTPVGAPVRAANTVPRASSVLGRQVGIAATDFYFSALDAFLATLGSGSVSQRVAVVFNSSDLLVVGSNRPCPNVTQQNSSRGASHHRPTIFWTTVYSSNVVQIHSFFYFMDLVLFLIIIIYFKFNFNLT